MHNILKKALPEAEGRSEFVVAVVADIRGFSEFSARRESPETAMYIKRVYVQLISRYFPNASFYKPTGDGLLITITYNDKTLQVAATATVAACLRCVEEFANICQGDPMINFEVPTRIGFGIAKGTACCLTSGGLVLDYSGQLLNLTSRLMDLARPSGIVIDGEFGLGLLSDEQQDLFEEDQVCVRGVSEEIPRRVYVLKDAVEIPEAARRPLRLEEWQTQEVEMTLREWELLGPRYGVDLERRLKRPDGLEVRMIYPKFRRRRRVGQIFIFVAAPFDRRLEAGRPLVALHVDEMLDLLRPAELPRTAKVRVVIDYVPE